MEFAAAVALLALAIVAIVSLGAWSRGSKRYPPGPRGIPLLGHLHLMGSQPMLSLLRISQRHGPIVMLKLGSVPTVLVASVDGAREVLSTHDAVFASRPRLASAIHLFYGGTDVLWSPSGPYWRLVKKVCTAELLTARRLEESRPVREGEIRRFLLGLLGDRREGERLIDVHSQVSMLTMNMMSMLTFRQRLFGDSSSRELVATVFQAIDLLGAFVVGDYFPWLAWLDRLGTVGRMKATHRKLDALFQRIVDEHLAASRSKSAEKTPDFVDLLVSLDEIDDRSTKALIMDMILGGSGTSSTTLEWALSLLIKHPSAMREAQSEIDRVVGDHRIVEESDLSNLPYLKAVIKETFRLQPGAFSIPRESMQECVVSGYTIPRGSRVLVNMRSIGRDPTVWDAPEEFVPDRFLEHGKNVGVDIRGKSFELIPFGSGRRLCPGISLGLSTVELTLATMIQAFDWRAPDLDMDVVFGMMVRKKVPLKALATPRLASLAGL